MREPLHSQAYALVLARWRKHMRRFFLAELPGSVAALVAAPSLAHLAGPHANATKPVLIGVAILLVAYVWARRMPPERPSWHDAGVLDLVDQLADARDCNSPSPSGPAA